MKKLHVIWTLFIALALTSGCEKDFDKLNTNPNSPTTLNPIFTFNNALVSSTFPAEVLVFESAIVQQVFSPNGTVLAGANFNQNNFPRNAVIWQRYYRDVVRYLVDIIDQTKSNPARSNLYNMARIWKAHAFIVLTDTYGDVPYSEAGLGFIGGTTFPKYDKQEAIYNDILKELTEAGAALDAAKTRETGDVMYGGDVTKWKKLANSLLLRAGMRLSKVNPTLAQSTAQKALAGGVFQNNTDNAVIKNDATYQNPTSGTLNATEANNYYLTKNFVDYLKSTNDPRLGSIAARYVGAKSGSEQTAARINRDPAVQIGMPLGFDNGTVAPQATKDGLASFYDYSQLDRTRMAKLAAPTFFGTHAQTQLLLAEAAQRGWVTGNVADYYNAGVTAHMQLMADYDAGSAIPAAAITSYLAANPYVATRGLELISTQYWVASFLNFPEGWANFRRTDLPVLVPNPYPAKTIKGNFIMRLTYPDSENSVNQSNLQTVITSQGADTMDTPVWWDK
ncbi:MAG: SusD/RagB family nutrient-binding outer membrane lipoprotein [Sphingobacteriaceae bacterium]|nr:SusD/RagB family nutrient-binding outer membrane lipoprotein [Cytophagaceae bacterium]